MLHWARIVGKEQVNVAKVQSWDPSDDTNIIKYDVSTRTIDYKNLVPFKDSNEPISGLENVDLPSCKETYDFLVAIEKKSYPLLSDIVVHF